MRIVPQPSPAKQNVHADTMRLLYHSRLDNEAFKNNLGHLGPRVRSIVPVATWHGIFTRECELLAREHVKVNTEAFLSSVILSVYVPYAILQRCGVSYLSSLYYYRTRTARRTSL